MTMRPVYTFSGCLLMLFFTAATGLVGCDSSSNGTTIRAPLSEENVESTLEWVEDSVTGCRLVDASLTSAPLALMQKVASDDRLASQMRAAGLTSSDEVLSGNCGGELRIIRRHGEADGLKDGHSKTIYDFKDFRFCFSDESSGDELEFKIDGTFIDYEQGTPGEDGPVVHARTAETDGKLIVKTPDGVISVILDGLTQVYGNPGAGGPGIPDRQNPDAITIKELILNFETEGVKHTIRRVEADVYENEDGNDVIEVYDGRYYTKVPNTKITAYLEIYTSPPLVVDSDEGHLISGALVFQGAKGDIVEVSPGTKEGLFVITRNGKALDRNMDCSDVDIPLLDMLMGLD